MTASKVSRPRGAPSTATSAFMALLVLMPAILLAGCASQERLTERATGCSKRNITIVGSDFKRDGVETAWCARCGPKLYQCATNADRSNVNCFEPKEGGPCF
jgi:uncharacterized protein YceK